MPRRLLPPLLTLVLLLAGLPAGLRPATAAPRAQSGPVTSHPRLWLTAGDLPRLRGWATDANPLWKDGLAVLAADRTADMDEGKVPAGDGGDTTYEEYATENYAELFAFLSLVDPDAAAREDDARRAREVLMYAIDEAAKGQAGEDTPFRQPDFATNDRSRWSGEAWALTVDWIYPALSTDDKATIRKVFLRWADEIVRTGYRHPGYDDPSLIGKVDDPALFANPDTARWAGNNYFTGNMRNLGLMAMALDPADDPGGELHAYLKIAIGAHLYMVDHLFRTDAAGGLGPEGFEYSPQAVGYVAQFLLALHTAGEDDPAVWGPQVRFDGNPFWDDVVPAYLHSISPRTVVVPGEEYLGPVYQPAWYGDGQTYWVPDMIKLFGPLGRYDDLTGNAARLGAIRWIETETPPGGAEQLLPRRVAEAEDHYDAILYFLLLDPAAPAPADPRPALPLFHFASGLGRLLVRTGWDADATWFTYALGWNTIDHQLSDGNQIELYRNGEWLTKGLVGYGAEFGDDDPSDDHFFPSSEYHNTLALENDAPLYNDPISDRPHQVWLRGSQWENEPAGDPTILALSIQPGYVYALGDATNLYNSSYENAMDITHASRSVVWLAPDAIVVYDRAASKTAGRFKRFWLNLPAAATVDGNRTTMTTATGQQLVVDTFQPSGATPAVQPLDVQVDVMATGEPMRYRLLVEAPGGPREARFLNVLQAADPGATVGPAVAIASDDESFTGAVVGTTAVLFPVDLSAAVGEVHYTVPFGTTTHLITGLTPGAGYDLTAATVGEGIAVTVTPGTTYRADDAGVLLVGSLPNALGTSSVAVTNTPAPSAVATPEAAGAATPGATPAPEQPTVQPAASPVTEGGAAATGSGKIVYNLPDGHVYRVAARAGASPEDLSLALDAEWPAATPAPAASPTAQPPSPDDWIAIAPDGTWLLLGTERFDPECAGWACLAIVRADLTSGEAVRTAAGVVHPEGPGAVAAGGNLVVYPDDGGPHALDLWAVSRQGDNWSAPVLLTGASKNQYNEQPTISADGARAVFDCGDASYAAAGTAICEVRTDGTGFRVVLTPADAPPGQPTTGAVHHPAYAPDGGIVFEGDWNSDSIWRLPPGASVPEPVEAAFTDDNAPCALPDGRIASLWRERPGGQSLRELKVMTSDGASYAMVVTDLDVEDIGCSS